MTDEEEAKKARDIATSAHGVLAKRIRELDSIDDGSFNFRASSYCGSILRAPRAMGKTTELGFDPIKGASKREEIRRAKIYERQREAYEKTIKVRAIKAVTKMVIFFIVTQTKIRNWGK